MTIPKIRFAPADTSFFSILRQRVESYFTENKIDSAGNMELHLKTGILTTLFLITYSLIAFVSTGIVVHFLLWAFMGCLLAAIGFNIMHDGSHSSYSKNTLLNKIMAYSLNFMGGNAQFWNQKHVVNHHTFTNVEGYDDDIDLRPLLRLHKDQRWMKIHKHQHQYAIPLYGLTYVFWIWFREYKKYFSGKIAINTPLKPFKIKDHINFWGWKAIHIGVFLVVPGLMFGFAQAIAGYLIMSFVTGILLAIVFQLAHIVEDTEFVAPMDSNSKIENQWAVHQINTTANFATDNKLVNWLLGGLNFQVEHHLFPKVSHVHYPKIHTIVKETCAEFNLQYQEFPTIGSALKSHLKHLKTIGNEF